MTNLTSREDNLESVVRTADRLARRMGGRFVLDPRVEERRVSDRSLMDKESLPSPR